MNVNRIGVLYRVEPSEANWLTAIVDTGFASIFEEKL